MLVVFDGAVFTGQMPGGRKCRDDIFFFFEKICLEV